MERELMRAARKFAGSRCDSRKSSIPQRRALTKNETSKNRMRYTDKEIFWWKYQFCSKTQTDVLLDISVGAVMDGEIGLAGLKSGPCPFLR
ncbi:hypothetical protein IB024_10270 [Brucella sp. 6810]|uniref:hypothetical protein n=1 Tax=Brucella sp. 6810 TaxID=2769351 RepID=UPI00165B4516|nr:hypothetical protein [Brucella sp. 6810]QNQ63349.1 hypothetical protein IB024_10270 [Brucella sp. 6810]